MYLSVCDFKAIARTSPIHRNAYIVTNEQLHTCRASGASRLLGEVRSVEVKSCAFATWLPYYFGYCIRQCVHTPGNLHLPFTHTYRLRC